MLCNMLVDKDCQPMRGKLRFRLQPYESHIESDAYNAVHVVRGQAWLLSCKYCLFFISVL